MAKIFGDSPELEKFDVYVDLDILESRKTGFKLHGVNREIKPISANDFFAVSNAVARLQGLKTKERVDGKEVFSAYLNLFSKLCTPFSREDLEKMSQHQCASLYQTVEDHIMGRFKKDLQEDAKKKTRTIQ